MLAGRHGGINRDRIISHAVADGSFIERVTQSSSFAFTVRDS
jgi:hypothetical protein